MALPDDGFVLDCSATMAWCFEDEATPYADAIQDRLGDVGALVPMIWPLEVANAALMGERRKRRDAARTGQFFALLDGLPIVVDGETSGKAFGEIARLARAHQLSAYDAAYLELAIRRSLPLASLDGRLKTAARAVGAIVLGEDTD